MLQLLKLNLRAGFGLSFARVHELAFVEEVGIGLLAIVEGLRRAFLCVLRRAAERDLRRLVIDGMSNT